MILRFVLVFMSLSCLNAHADVEENGHNISVLLAIGALTYTYHVEDDNEGAKQFGMTFLSSQTVTSILKKTTGKTRPNGNCCESFPSGHATAAFASAAFMHQRYGFVTAIPSYLGATYTAYSRVEADKHFVEDVVAGAAIAITASYYFTDLYEPEKQAAILPVLSTDMVGLNYIASF